MISLWLFTFGFIAAPAACTRPLPIGPDDSYPATIEESPVKAVKNLTPDLPEQINVSLSFETMELKNLSYGFAKSEFLTHLSLKGSQIERISLLAFEFVPRLSHLNLADNLLQNIDLDQFSNLKILKTLNLNGNCKVTEKLTGVKQQAFKVALIPCKVNLSTEVTSLTKLWLQNNNLEQLIFTEGTNLPLLTHLYLSGNQLSLDDDMMSNLSELAPSLSDLHLDNSMIDEFDASALPTLTSLNLDGNSIYFVCNEYCNLPSLKLRAARNLKTLSASRNKISRIDADAFDYATSLVTLDLSHNQISEIPAGTFDKLHLLQSLSLENNHLVKLTDLYALRSLINLETLSLGYNDMRTITGATFEDLVALKTLTLDHNKISDINSGAFSKLTSLQTLSLAGNLLSRIPAGCMPTSGSLITLKLNDNKFTSNTYISFADLPNLLFLYLKENPLTTMTLNWYSSTPENMIIIVGNTCSGGSLSQGWA